MRELVLPHFLRIASDHSSAVRLAFIHLAEHALSSHIQSCGEAEVAVNVELVVMLLVLMAEQVKEVENEATKALTSALSHFEVPPSEYTLPHHGEDIEDGEMELRNARQRPPPPPGSGDGTPLNNKLYLSRYLSELTQAFIEGISGWTTGSQALYLGGLNNLCREVGCGMGAVLGQLLLPLGSCLLDDDSAIRTTAEKVCQTLGECLPCLVTETTVLPYISGSPAGHDNPRSRAVGVRLAHHMLIGHLKSIDNVLQLEPLKSLVLNIGLLLIAFELHESRDLFLREAVLLFVRVLIDVLGRESPIMLDEDSKSELEFATVTCLVLLMGRVQGDPGGVLLQVRAFHSST